MKQIFVAIALILFAQEIFAGGTITYPEFFSESLQKNNTIGVYLPEGYDPASEKRYPVIYFLHGAYSSFDPYIPTLMAGLDELISNNKIQPFIMVTPDGSAGPWGGTCWANSALYGLFEDYVTKDVVAYIDSAYLTFASPKWRAIMGFSDGGDGAMICGLRHPDVYRTIAAHSGLYNFDLFRGAVRTAVLAENPGPPYNYSPTNGPNTNTLYRNAGAYSPNLSKPPYYVDLPYDKNGNIDEKVLDQWKAYNADSLIIALLPQEVPDIYFTCGTEDNINFDGNTWLVGFLEYMMIPYTFDSFHGGHTFKREHVLSMLSHINASILKLTSVPHKQAPSISNFELHRNYPNPFNPSTTIQFDIPKLSKVTLKIIDMLGREVATLVDEQLHPGEHKVIVDSRTLPSGVYFYRLQSEEFSATKKLLLMK